MGTDIHTVFQANIDGIWQDIESKYQEDRHYSLFARLAGVRNGYGFAGVVTGQPVAPIASPRGFPEDFPLEDYDTHNGQWMGDHSHSWVNAEEILAYQWGNKPWKTGIISVSQFDEWDGVSPPSSYCGGVFGPGISVADSPVAVDENTTHVRVYWRERGTEYDYFLDEIKRLRDEYGDVRMVFGFDS